METRSDKPASSLPSFTWVYGVAALLALAILGVGIYRLTTDGDDWTMLAAGALGLVAVAVTWPIALTLSSSRGGAAAGTDPAVAGLANRLDQMTTLLTRVSDQQLLSDRAKHIAFRDKERDKREEAMREQLEALRSIERNILEREDRLRKKAR